MLLSSVVEQLKRRGCTGAARDGGIPQPAVCLGGMFIETLLYRNIVFTVWNVGSHSGFRRLHRPYFSGTEGVIFVLDADTVLAGTQIKPAYKKDLDAMLQEPELQRAVCLMLVTEGSEDIDVARVQKKVDATHGQGRVHVQPIAGDGDGLDAGLDWLARNTGSFGRNVMKAMCLCQCGSGRYK